MTQLSCTTGMDIGDKIRELRLAKGLKPEDLSRLIGRSVASVSRLENGHHKPRLATLQALARVFGVSLDALADDNGEVSADQLATAEDISLMDAALAAARAGSPAEALEKMRAAAVQLAQSHGARKRPKNTPSPRNGTGNGHRAQPKKPRGAPRKH